MIRRVHKFVGLPAADQFLLLKTMLLVALVTLGLRVVSFHNLRRLLAALSHRNGSSPSSQRPAARVVWAVKIAGRYVPAASCLPQALTTQTMLKRRGYPAQIHIGLARSEAGMLEAHAWVESEGRVLVGDLTDLARYTPLPSLEGQAE